MSSTTKYSVAPQHDPDQAPPIYGTNGESSAGPSSTHILDGDRRSEDDNLPDDFKFGSSVYDADIEIRHAFIRKVYAILTMQMLLTAIVSSLTFFSPAFKSWIQNHPAMVLVSFASAMVFMGLAYWKRKSYPVNLAFLAGFTLAESYTVAIIVSFYDVSVVLQALVVTCGIFAFLTAFAFQTKYDFRSWQPYLAGALWALVLTGFVGAFMPFNSTMEIIYAGASALIFSGYVLFDTQMLMTTMHPEEEIAAAISLYLDIINLFIAILRIMNQMNRD